MRFRAFEIFEFDTYSWVNRVLYHEDKHRIGFVNLGDAYQQFCRMCLKINIPVYTYDHCIKRVTLRVKYEKSSYIAKIPKVKMLRQKNDEIIGEFNPLKGYESPIMGKEVGDYLEFDITDHYKRFVDNKTFTATYIFMSDEECGDYYSTFTLIGTDSEKDAPKIIIEY